MRRAAFLLPLALSAVLVGCSGTSDAGKTWASVTPHASSTASKSSSGPVGSFTSPDGYWFIPPVGWKEYPDAETRVLSSVFVAPGPDPAAKFVDNINVVINDNPKDLDSTVTESKQILPTVLTDYRVVVDEPATADGQPAHLLGGTYVQGTAHLENLQLVLLADGKQYTVTFTCPAASFKALRSKAEASLLSLHLS